MSEFVIDAILVAVSAFPVTSPVTSPVNAPMKPVAVILPVDGLYVRVPSLSRPKLPPVCAPPAVNMIALSSLVLSLSVIVTVVAIAAVPLVSAALLGMSPEANPLASMLISAAVAVMAVPAIAKSPTAAIFTRPEPFGASSRLMLESSPAAEIIGPLPVA